MKSPLIFAGIFLYFATVFVCVHAELEFYPGYQRPRIVLNVDNEQTAEEYALEQLTNYLQEQQRQLELRQAEELASDFQFMVPVDNYRKPEVDFAVAPPDPLYYQTSPEEYDFLDNVREPEVVDEIRREPDEVPAVEPVKKVRSDDELTKTNSVHHLREQDLNRYITGNLHHSDQTVDVVPVKPSSQDESAGVYIIAVIAGISAAATVGLIAFAIGWYNLQKNVKNSSDVEYPAYGVTGPNKDVSPTGDRRLAQSAQMYHYQHQKQQIIAMESRAAATVRHGSMSEAESDEENEEGDYTVYECPGLAPAGEMEVKNPLFQDDPTPASQPPVKDDHSTIPDQK